MRTAGNSVIRAVLDEFDALAGGADHDALADRHDSARLRVVVACEAKRGKSTLVNAMLGREVLPAGVVPLTAVRNVARLFVRLPEAMAPSTRAPSRPHETVAWVPVRRPPRDRPQTGNAEGAGGVRSSRPFRVADSSLTPAEARVCSGLCGSGTSATRGPQPARRPDL
jgi:Dynamin family